MLSAYKSLRTEDVGLIYDETGEVNSSSSNGMFKEVKSTKRYISSFIVTHLVDSQLKLNESTSLDITHGKVKVTCCKLDNVEAHPLSYDIALDSACS